MSGRAPKFAMNAGDDAERDEARLRSNARALERSAGAAKAIAVLCGLMREVQIRAAREGRFSL